MSGIGSLWGREPAMVLALVQCVIVLGVSFGLGSIVEESGQDKDTVVYQRNAAGDNVVVVRDSSGDEAYCIISQPAG